MAEINDCRLEIVERDGVIVASVVFQGVAGWIGTFNARLRDTCPGAYEHWVENMGNVVREMLDNCGCDVVSIREVQPR